MSPLPLQFFCGKNQRGCHEALVVKSNVTVYEYHATLERVRASISLVCAIAGIIGNGLVIAVYTWMKGKLSKHKMLICMLAASDFLFAIILLVIVIPIFWTSKWIYGTAMCKVLIGFNDLGVLLAMGIILIIAFERYYGITQPLQRLSGGMSTKQVWIFLAINLAAAVAMIIPEMVVLDLPNGVEICQENWPNQYSSLIYTYVLLGFYFIVPICIITYLYTESIAALKEFAGKEVKGNIENPLEAQRKQEQHQNNRRIMLILIGILVSFVVLVLPNRLVWVVFSHVEDMTKLSETTYLALKYVAMMPYPFHVAINPVIYCLCDRQFRRNVSEMAKSAASSAGRRISTVTINSRLSVVSFRKPSSAEFPSSLSVNTEEKSKSVDTINEDSGVYMGEVENAKNETC